MSDRFGNIPIEPSPSQPQLPAKPHKKKKPSSSPGKKKDHRKTGGGKWAWLIVLLALVGAYSALGFWGVPYFITGMLPSSIYDETGFSLEVEEAKFNPFTYTLQLTNATLSTGPNTPVFSIYSLKADLAPVSLLRHDLVCNAITVDKLEANVVREQDGSYNISPLIGGHDTSASEIMDFSDLPFFFSFNNIAIHDSVVHFVDTPAGKTHVIEAIQLELPTFSNIPFQTDQYLRPHFSAIVNGSPIELSGQAQLGDAKDDSIASKLSCTLTNIDLSKYTSYLPFRLPAEFTEGIANGTLELHFSSDKNEKDRVIVSFQLQISEAHLRSKESDIEIVAPKASITGALRPVTRSIDISNLTVREPQVLLDAETPMAVALDSLLGTVLEHSPADDPNTIRFATTIDLFIIDNGSIGNMAKGGEGIKDVLWHSVQLSIKDYTTVPRANGAPGQGTFRISAEQQSGDGQFVWQGTFHGAQRATGVVNIVKISADYALDVAITNNPFTVTGQTDIKGDLTINAGHSGDTDGSFELTNAKVNIQNFKMTSPQRTVLSCPGIRFSPVHFNGKALSLGNVYMQKAKANFDADSLPPGAQLFTDGTIALDGIDFEGEVDIFQGAEPDPLIVFKEFSIKTNLIGKKDELTDNIALLARTGGGGIVKAQGDLYLTPFTLTLRTGISDFPLAPAVRLFSGKDLAVDGLLAGKGTLTLPQRSFAGELLASNIVMAGADTQEGICSRALLKNFNYTHSPVHLGIAAANLDGCQARWTFTGDSVDPLVGLGSFLQDLLPSNPEKDGKKQKITISAVDIQKITINSGRISLTDNRVSPPWSATVTEFNGVFENLHETPAAGRCTYFFSGSLDDTAFEITGDGELLSREPRGTYKLNLEEYPLASFHQQLSPELDIDTQQGDVVLTMESEVLPDRRESNALLRFHNVTPLSATAKSALPLALITGQDNSFSLQIDNNSTPDLPSESLIDKARTHFQTLVVKASVSPLLLASGDFTDLIDNEFAEFRPGEFMLSDHGREIITRYTALLIAHPHIGLRLSGGVDPVVDRAAMQAQLEAIEQQRVEEENRKRFAAWQEKKNNYEMALKQQAAKNPDGSLVEVDIPKGVLDDFVPLQPAPVTVSDEMLLDLANKRLSILQQYFITQLVLHPDRVVIDPPAGLDLPARSPANGIAIELRAVDRL